MPRRTLAAVLRGELGARVEHSLGGAAAQAELGLLFERAEREQASDEELALAACALAALYERGAPAGS